MKRKIYLFNRTSTAANYGIGQYIEQIIRVLKDTDIVLTIVELYSREVREATATKKDDADRIIIPYVKTNFSSLTEKSDNRYIRNAVYLLKEYIPDNEENLFHLNYMEDECLATWLKKLFKAKVV
jgi:hypothetical protein